MPTTSEPDHRIAGIAALDQPLRRNLYRLLSERDGWTTRDEAADRALLLVLRYEGAAATTAGR